MPATKAKAPKSQADQYARARQIAERDGIVVKPVTIEGVTVYVTVRPVNMSVHIVRRIPTGLTCDGHCMQSNLSRYCAHRAAVRAHLLAEREAERRHFQEMDATARETDATLARVSRALDESERRDTAPRVTGKAFSLFK